MACCIYMFIISWFSYTSFPYPTHGSGRIAAIAFGQKGAGILLELVSFEYFSGLRVQV
jgi:hypothetical protein